MGGIVARYALIHESYLDRSIHSILTLNTPHQNPPFDCEPTLNFIYKKINAKNNSLKNVILVSLSGGDNDTLVRNELKNLNELVDHSHGFTSYTTSIPHVWSATNHDMVSLLDFDLIF